MDISGCLKSKGMWKWSQSMLWYYSSIHWEELKNHGNIQPRKLVVGWALGFMPDTSQMWVLRQPTQWFIKKKHIRIRIGILTLARHLKEQFLHLWVQCMDKRVAINDNGKSSTGIWFFYIEAMLVFRLTVIRKWSIWMHVLEISKSMRKMEWIDMWNKWSKNIITIASLKLLTFSCIECYDYVSTSTF